MNILIATLIDVIDAQQNYSTGNAEASSVTEAKERFSKALEEFVEMKIRASFDRRRTNASQEMLAVAGSIDSNIRSTASTIRGLAALNSAPIPPDDVNDPDELKKWKINYKAWYENNRKDGMKM